MKDYILNKTIDVIIPIYNTPAHLLERCLLSVLGQTYKQVRIIAIDDGSTRKETLDIIERFLKNKKVKLYKQKNAGVSVARNVGLENSDGDYVFFLDSDDYMDEDYLERLLKNAQEEQVGLVFSGKIKIPGNNNDAPFVNHRIDLKRNSELITLKAHVFTCSAVLIDGKLARSERFTTTTTMGEDTEYIIKLMAKSDSFFEGKGGCYYVQNSESLTHNNSIASIRRFLDESVLEAEALRNYIKPTEEVITLFLNVKALGSYRKISIYYDEAKARKIIIEHLKKYKIKKPSMKTIIRTPYYGIGLKARLVLLRRGCYGVIHIIDMFALRIKVKNEK